MGAVDREVPSTLATALERCEQQFPTEFSIGLSSSVRSTVSVFALALV